MSLIENLKGLKNKSSSGQVISKDVLQTTKNWFNDRNEFVLVQRNMSFFAVIILTVTVAIMVLSATYYLQNSRTIEPFVIEIEQKTGVASVVDPQSIKVYSSSESVARHAIWTYVKNRHEYFYSTYTRQFEYIRANSIPVIYKRFLEQYGQGNPQSPVEQLGPSSFRTIELKSMIILEGNIAEIRFKEVTQGTFTGSVDKFARVTYTFGNLGLNDNDRLLNPLGFNVTEYQVTDERN